MTAFLSNILKQHSLSPGIFPGLFLILTEKCLHLC
nr:MAG TPA: hypothetical protein [Caudoviricetes sp.]